MDAGFPNRRDRRIFGTEKSGLGHPERDAGQKWPVFSCMETGSRSYFILSSSNQTSSRFSLPFDAAFHCEYGLTETVLSRLNRTVPLALNASSHRMLFVFQTSGSLTKIASLEYEYATETWRIVSPDFSAISVLTKTGYPKSSRRIRSFFVEYSVMTTCVKSENFFFDSHVASHERSYPIAASDFSTLIFAQYWASTAIFTE